MSPSPQRRTWQLVLAKWRMEPIRLGWPVQQHPSHQEEELPAFECTNATVMVDSKALDDTCRRHLDVKCTVHLVNCLLAQTVASLTVSLHFFGARVCG